MGMNYEYDEEAAGHAEDFANRINETGPYIGTFKRAEAFTASKGTAGIRFEFEGESGGNCTTDLYTEKGDGTRIQGFNKVQAAMTILKLRSLKAVPGTVQVWDEDERKWVDGDGEVYEELVGKPIGVFFEKEYFTNGAGKDTYRMNIAGFFDPKTKLTASEIKERKVKPEKFEKIVKTLRTVDNRKAKAGASEPGQPPMGVAGDY